MIETKSLDAAGTRGKAPTVTFRERCRDNSTRFRGNIPPGPIGASADSPYITCPHCLGPTFARLPVCAQCRRSIEPERSIPEAFDVPLMLLVGLLQWAAAAALMHFVVLPEEQQNLALFLPVSGLTVLLGLGGYGVIILALFIGVARFLLK